MKKYLSLALLLFVFAGFAKAQGPQSTANWFGYILPSSPADSIVANHVIIGRPGLYAKEETRSKGLKI